MAGTTEVTQAEAARGEAAGGEGHTARLMSEIRGTPLFRQLIPLEAGVGWPIPLMRGGRVYLKLPFFGFTRDHRRRQTLLTPPFATVTLDWKSGKPVEYLSLKFRNPWPGGEWDKPAGVFPHPAVAQMSKVQYMQARAKLLRMYDELLEMMTAAATPAPEWRERFSALLRLLVEPPLAPFYRALGPRFYETFLPPAAG